MPFWRIVVSFHGAASARCCFRDKRIVANHHAVSIALLQYQYCLSDDCSAPRKESHSSLSDHSSPGDRPMIDNRFAPYGAFLLRAALGVMFIAHAYLKIAVFTVPGFAAFLGQVGFPGFLAWPIILAELIGGLAIIAGFYSRLASLALLPI